MKMLESTSWQQALEAQDRARSAKLDEALRRHHQGAQEKRRPVLTVPPRDFELEQIMAPPAVRRCAAFGCSGTVRITEGIHCVTHAPKKPLAKKGAKKKTAAPIEDSVPSTLHLRQVIQLRPCARLGCSNRIRGPEGIRCEPCEEKAALASSAATIRFVPGREAPKYVSPLMASWTTPTPREYREHPSIAPAPAAAPAKPPPVLKLQPATAKVAKPAAAPAPRAAKAPKRTPTPFAWKTCKCGRRSLNGVCRICRYRGTKEPRRGKVFEPCEGGCGRRPYKPGKCYGCRQLGEKPRLRTEICIASGCGKPTAPDRYSTCSDACARKRNIALWRDARRAKPKPKLACRICRDEIRWPLRGLCRKPKCQKVARSQHKNRQTEKFRAERARAAA